jgi:hypothetical protein
MCIVLKFFIDWFMIMVSLVLKLFISSRPLKLEGVLCIYVLLFYKGQAENHLLWFSVWFEHTLDFHCFIVHDLSFVFLFMLQYVAKFLLSRLCLLCPCSKFFNLSTQCLHKWSRLWWCMSPQKLFFCLSLTYSRMSRS